MIQSLLTLTASALYLAAGGGLLLRLLRRPEPDTLRGPSMLLAVLAVVVYAPLIWQRPLGEVGLDLGFFGAAALTGWLMSVLLLLASRLRPLENVGLVVFPLAAATSLLHLLIPGTAQGGPAPGTGVETHIVLSVLAYSVLALAAIQAIVLAIQEARLRHHQPGGFVRMLPPLAAMESVLFDLLWGGFALLTLALASGALFVEDLFAQHLVHKTVLSVVAWLVFGLLLGGRIRYGWRGQTAIRWTLGGFLALLLAYFGSKFVLELVLGR